MDKNKQKQMLPISPITKFIMVIENKLNNLSDLNEKIKLLNCAYNDLKGLNSVFPKEYDIFMAGEWHRGWKMKLGIPTFDFAYLYPHVMLPIDKLAKEMEVKRLTEIKENIEKEFEKLNLKF